MNMLEEKPNCPVCGSADVVREDHQWVRSAWGEDVWTSRFRCLDCGAEFLWTPAAQFWEVRRP